MTATITHIVLLIVVLVNTSNAGVLWRAQLLEPYDLHQPSQLASYFISFTNCSSYATYQDGSLICADAPYDYLNPLNGNWQFAPGFRPVISGYQLPLFYCGLCSTSDCGGQQLLGGHYDSLNVLTCTGTTSTADFGATWQCNDAQCPEGTIQLANSYTCSSKSCNGISSMQYDGYSWECQDPACDFMNFKDSV